jgi:hypothetical protein
MAVSKTDARELAIAYDAYNDANSANNMNSLTVWGQRLLDLQEKTGIELHDNAFLRRRLERTRRMAA